MKLTQKVFWIFFSIVFITLILALNQFVTYYTQQNFNTVVSHIHNLQNQVRQLDQMRLSLFLPDNQFDKEGFERLVKRSSETRVSLRSDLPQISTPLLAKLDRMDFHLKNYSRSLLELAESIDEYQKLTTVIHKSLRALHLHDHFSAQSLRLHQSKPPYFDADEAGITTISDLELIVLLSSYVHHRKFELLPQVEQVVARIKLTYKDDILAAELDQLMLMLVQYYQSDLHLADRRQFVETASENFLSLTHQMLVELADIGTKKQRWISQLSVVISIFGVLAAFFYWYRIRIYLRRFLFNQNQVMHAIKDESEDILLSQQSNDELGALTSTLKNLSVELKGKKEDLLVSEKKYRLLVESLSDWIWETNANNRFSYCNQAGEQITGYSPVEMVGRKYLVLSRDCEEVSVFEHIEGHFRAQTPFVNLERKILCADGSLRHLISSGIPLFDNEGGFIGFRGIDRDITALVEAREKHDQLEMKLQHAQKMESIGRLAGGIAHDFNNILSAIIGYTELILLRLEKDHRCYKHVREIRSSGERAASLTRQLLAFSRKQARKPEILDLGREVHELDDMLQRLVGEQVSIQIRSEGGLWPVCVDKSQLEQVIVNLTVNAKDAMPDGGRIDIILQNVSLSESNSTSPSLAGGDYVQLTVADNGCGMVPEVMQNIFDPFFTTKGQDKGTGLGLAMVYGIVTQNNGDIQVSSELDKGTRFQILLPRSRQPAKFVGTLPQDKALRKGSEAILMVEDEAVLLTMHADFLRSLGYRVITAVDGHDALQKFSEMTGKLDLLVTDIVMPNMGGVELAGKLAEKIPHLKVLYMSGYTDHKLFDQGVLQEGVNFLHKPVSPIDVVNFFEKLLD